MKEEQIALLFHEFQETAHPTTSSLAKALQTELDDYFTRKAAGQTKENGEIIIVVADEEPKERQAVVKAIVNSTKKIDRDEELGIGFAQIGEHSLTQGFFSALDDDLQVAGAHFDIVDTKILDPIKLDQFVNFLMSIIHD